MTTCYTDRLDPRASTWINLEPVEPHVRALLVRGYRELLETSRWLKDAEGVARAELRLAELGATP